MSYDLYLSSPKLTAEAFADYFAARRNYQEPGWYANEDTGVYFGFSFSELGEDDPEAPTVMQSSHVAFNLNYFRPHVFGLEAEPEVSAFVSAFGCQVHDPQFEGMGDGPYSSAAFLRGWNVGNLFGYKAIVERGIGDDALVADDAAIEKVWRWNLTRAEQQAADPNGHFFPRANWAKRANDGNSIAFAVWGEGVASALPDCATHALLARESRGSLFGARKSGMDVKLMPIETIGSLSGCEWRQTAAGRVLLAPATVPPSRAVRTAFGKGFETMEAVAKAVPVDHVLDASLMQQVKS